MDTRPCRATEVSGVSDCSAAHRPERGAAGLGIFAATFLACRLGLLGDCIKVTDIGLLAGLGGLGGGLFGTLALAEPAGLGCAVGFGEIGVLGLVGVLDGVLELLVGALDGVLLAEGGALGVLDGVLSGALATLAGVLVVGALAGVLDKLDERGMLAVFDGALEGRLEGVMGFSDAVPLATGLLACIGGLAGVLDCGSFVRFDRSLASASRSAGRFADLRSATANEGPPFAIATFG